MVGPKKQDFWPILRIRGAPVRQKLAMILENKVVQKMKLEKIVFFTKNGLLNLYSSMNFFFEKIVDFCHF